MVAYQEVGRTQQKLRTRAALKAAATELIEAGGDPTVAEVAEAAGISKSTAYRYFPSQEQLHAEVFFSSSTWARRQAVHAAAAGDVTAAERLDRVIRADHTFSTENQDRLRAALRAFLGQLEMDPETPLEPSHRVRFLRAALTPVADRLPEPTLRRLVAALSLCVGVEAAMITQVNCELNADDAEDVKRWAANTLLQAALAEAGVRL